MNLNGIFDIVGKKKARKRCGRGEGSGLGKTSGRGSKGAKARSGWRRRYGYEGGQMPLVRRVPKRGFNNFNFADWFDVVNVGELGVVFDDGATVDRQTLIDRGVLKPRHEKLKLLGDGELKKKLTITVHSASGSARQKVEAAGGTLNCLIPPRPVRKPRPQPGKPPAGGKAKDAAGGEAPPEGKQKKEKAPKADKAAKSEKPEKTGEKKEKAQGGGGPKGDSSQREKGASSHGEKGDKGQKGGKKGEGKA